MTLRPLHVNDAEWSLSGIWQPVVCLGCRTEVVVVYGALCELRQTAVQNGPNEWSVTIEAVPHVCQAAQAAGGEAFVGQLG